MPPIKPGNLIQEKVKVENSINTAKSRLSETERELKSTMDEVHTSFNGFSRRTGTSPILRSSKQPGTTST